VRDDPRCRPAQAQAARQGADDLRDAGAVHRAHGPGRRRGFQGLMEAEFRQRHIGWIVNAKIAEVRDGEMDVVEVDEDSQPKKTRTLPCEYSMVLPAFTGVDAVRRVEGRCNPRGFVLIDRHQRNPVYANIHSVGVCVAIPPVEATPVPTGAPKTGFMIESMVTAVARN